MKSVILNVVVVYFCDVMKCVNEDIINKKKGYLLMERFLF